MGKELGSRITETLQRCGMTQKELAEILGVSENSISLYERNINTPDDAMKLQIAQYFNVSLDYLLGATKKQLPLKRTGSRFLFVENLPENAYKELKTFLEYLQNKYNL